MSSISEILLQIYPWTLVFHVISVISWMAGIFYLPRIFVYHVEKSQAGDKLDAVFQTMERKLLRYIMNPAMISSWVFGVLLTLTPGLVDWSEVWPWVKAVAVISMTIFHHLVARWRKDFVAGENQRSSRFFRLANEAPTLLMIVIVVMVIARPF